MALAPLHEALIAALTARLDGWQFVKAHRDFKKPGPSYNWFAHLAFINHVNDFDAVLDVAVEYHAKRKRICIVGAEIGNILGIGQRRWPVATGEDVRNAARGIETDLMQVGIPFLTRYSDIGEILRIYRTDPVAAGLIAPLTLDHAAEADAIERRIQQYAG
jgi:hypothetical protein